MPQKKRKPATTMPTTPRKQSKVSEASAIVKGTPKKPKNTPKNTAKKVTSPVKKKVSPKKVSPERTKFSPKKNTSPEKLKSSPKQKTPEKNQHENKTSGKKPATSPTTGKKITQKRPSSQTLKSHPKKKTKTNMDIGEPARRGRGRPRKKIKDTQDTLIDAKQVKTERPQEVSSSTIPPSSVPTSPKPYNTRGVWRGLDNKQTFCEQSPIKAVEQLISNDLHKNVTLTDQNRQPSDNNAAIKVEADDNQIKSTSLKLDKVLHRNTGRKFVGAHTSIAGGIENSVINAVDIGAKAFALFLRSQRQWVTKPLKEGSVEKFKKNCEKYNFPPHLIIPHGSYLMNCGSPDPEILEKSRSTLVEELERCKSLGLSMFNFHPGSSCGEIPREECLDRIGASINQAHDKTQDVVTVIENMCCQGNTVGGKFEELRGIIDRVKDKSRIGICLDTCHMFAAGYNIQTLEGYNDVMSNFENIVGLNVFEGCTLE
uniref:DNA-(Apurinic or apyrimidinic site) lyase-like n=1 Tax=Saccoglossus kowalevskii TaxID=10224 RepID=A0ABM0MP78_SACKO|nr:PREDICTED: DNA-(apurinic or apyrimidinic site) lyase-like [Saccoglossus kowalevskii]